MGSKKGDVILNYPFKYWHLNVVLGTQHGGKKYQLKVSFV